MRSFIMSVATGLTVVFATRYFTKRSSPQAQTQTALAADQTELESETWA